LQERPVATWDVFHADRLELERGLDAAAIRDALARGDLRDDDLVRPTGTTITWALLADLPELGEAPDDLRHVTDRASVESPESAPESIPGAVGTSDLPMQVHDGSAGPDNPPAPALRAADWVDLRTESDDVAFPVIKDDAQRESPGAGRGVDARPATSQWRWSEDDDDDEKEDAEDEEEVELDQGSEVADDLAAENAPFLEDSPAVDLDVFGPGAGARGEDSQSSRIALPVVVSRGWDDVAADQGADADEVISLSRGGPATVEELDLAPMVDVAFQLVLFFMVTATTVLYKTLEIPKPTTEQAPAAVAQGRSLADLQSDYIVVEIDAAGLVQIDRQPVAANMSALVERLRKSREATHRKAMLLSADFATPHRSSVLAYDAANEIGLGIVIARPPSPQGPAPSLLARPPQPPRAAAPPSGVPN
jgi:biopolymer transport protein ExbD